MSKWVDADALKASYIVTSTTTNSLCHLYVSIEDINSAPSIDIVRCKECKHWWETTGANYGDCEHFALDTIADAFCSYGERKDECKECWNWSEVHKRCENKCGCQFKPYGERKESK